MTPFRTLYIDMDSFFASVEQQADASLRGRPVGITALVEDAGCLVAASYEAKAHGVRTGTRVHEAKRLCPDITLRPSRHRLYARVNREIAGVIDEIAELEFIRSIDEFQVRLDQATSDRDSALDLGRDLKSAIRDRVGSELSSSVGIGPSHLLAKIAGKLDKPDGLEFLGPENMPARLNHLALDDLPGISRGIRKRLGNAGVTDIAKLHALDPRHARAIWRSVEGERFVRMLQGEDIPLLPTKRSTYGNSKVLAPQYRNPTKAYAVGRWLVDKAAYRLRRDGWCSGRFGLSVRIFPEGRWSQDRICPLTQDTRFFLSVYGELWSTMMDMTNSRKIASVSINLGRLVKLDERTGDIINAVAPGERTRGEILCHAIDSLNYRFGRRSVIYGTQLEHPGFFERG